MALFGRKKKNKPADNVQEQGEKKVPDAKQEIIEAAKQKQKQKQKEEKKKKKKGGLFGKKGKKVPEAAEILGKGMTNIKDIIAPSAIEVDFNHLKIGNEYYRTLFVSGYPRFVGANWLSPIINFEHTLDISMFYYPIKSKGILDDLRRKITEMEATVRTNEERGKISDPTVSVALDDAKALQEQLVKGVEKFFQFSFYITIRASTLEQLNNVTKKLESTLGSLLLISKAATLQMEEAFQSTIPTALDKLLITRNMDTTSLATTFPFTSSDLTSDRGIMYGINKHNGSLVIFDRFSLENANTVVFAKSGSGKSYFVKLEALRLMTYGAEVIIIDPEAEYETIAQVVGGDFIGFSANSPAKINPFDLSGIVTEGENELGQKILSLHTLFQLILGKLTPSEEALLDRALIETYRIKGITTDPDTQRNKEPPVLEDLYKVLLGAAEPEARPMAERLEKYIRGSLAGIFDSQSNLDFSNKMTVFSVKNLEETLRPVAFYIILDFVWTRVKRSLKKRVLIVEEAWYMLQNDDSARFIYGVAKRARKYYLGLTTITQDVDDFLTSEYGKVIVTNSSIQMLLKQHPAAIDRLAKAFYLSEGEKRFLLAADLGEGLFFAGANHVAIKVEASPEEHRLITTNPEEILAMKQEAIRAAQEREQKEKEAERARRQRATPVQYNAPNPQQYTIDQQQTQQQTPVVNNPPQPLNTPTATSAAPVATQSASAPTVAVSTNTAQPLPTQSTATQAENIPVQANTPQPLPATQTTSNNVNTPKAQPQNNVENTQAQQNTPTTAPSTTPQQNAESGLKSWEDYAKNLGGGN